MTRNALFAVPFALLLFSPLSSPVSAQWPRYRVTYLGEGQPPLDLNDSAEISANYLTGPSNPAPAIWKNGTWTALPSRYLWSTAGSINNSSQVVGSSATSLAAGEMATFWPNTSTAIDLGTLPGTNNSRAEDINSEGVIVGVCWFDTGNGSARPYQAFTYSGAIAPLPSWGTPTGSYATAINDSGDVVTYQWQPFTTVISREGAVTEVIPDFAGYAVNNRKVVAGETTTTWEPAYWSNGTVVSLPNPPGGSQIWDINDAGTIVGARKSNVRGLIWKNGEMRVLEELTLQSCLIEVAYAINNKGEIACRGRLLPDGTTGVLLLTPVGKVTSPGAGATWTAGEQDTIRWADIEKGVSLVIELSHDDGRTYQELASNVPSDAGKSAVTIPKDILSTKCLIRLRDNSTLDSLAASDQFRIKPYLLTKIAPSSGEYIPYTVPSDQWGFANTRADIFPLSWYARFDYRGIDPFTGNTYSQSQGGGVFQYAVPADFPDWVSFVRAFTVDACYWSTKLGIYKGAALQTWRDIKRVWGGSCFGIAISNALAFERDADFRNKYTLFPAFTYAQQVLSDTNVFPVINELFTHQYGNPHRAYRDNVAILKTPTETVSDLKRVFKEDLPTRTLGILNNGLGGGGHAILPYKVDRVSTATAVWDVHVYDNSYPNVADAIIKVDTSQNGGKGTWAPQYAWAGWGGEKWFYLRDSALSYLANPVLPKASLPNFPFELQEGVLEVHNTVTASVRIADGEGHTTGFVNKYVASDIPESIPLVREDGSTGPPYGYLLPAGNYTVKLDSFETEESRASFFFGNRIIGYERSGADSSQTDNLRIDTSGSIALSYANPDPTMKTITLRSILSEPTEEKVYTIRSMNLSANDSLVMKNVDSDRLMIASYGPAKAYTIRVENASPAALRLFERANVPLAANSAHTIVPDWATLGDGLLTILVDVGKDGTVDDTLHLKNELTSAQGQGSLIPGGYRLEQNYPNPFNSSTTIRYGLPRKSVVRLTVYNILGQEVAAVVNEEKEAGYHEVRFDGTGLASGMYIYRLEAGDFVQSRKLILVR